MSGPDVVRWLLDLAQTAAGPHGRAVAMMSGIVNVSAASDEVLRMVVEWMRMPDGIGDTDVVARRLVISQHPFTKLMQQTVAAHVKRAGGGGWYLLYVAAALSSWGYDSKGTGHEGGLPPSVIQYAFDVLREWVCAFFESDIVASRALPAGGGKPLAAVLATELAANAALALTPREAGIIASQAIRSFLSVVDPKTNRLDMDAVRYVSVVSDTADVTASDVLEGFVIDWGFPLEIALLYGADGRLPPTPSSGYRVCLFDCCVEPEVTYTAADGEEVNLIETDADAAAGGGFEAAAWRRLFAVFEHLHALGVQVVASQKTIHARLRLWLADRGIVALERLSIRHIDAFRSATGAVMHKTPSLSITAASFGSMTTFEEISFDVTDGQRRAGRRYVTGCEGPPGGKRYIRVVGPKRAIFTHVLRHAHSHVLTEMEVQLKRAQRLVATSLRDPHVVPGGGVTDIVLAEYIAARAKLAAHATRGSIARLAPHLADEVARVAVHFTRILRGWAAHVALGTPPGPHGAPSHTAAPMLDAVAAANIDRHRLHLHVVDAMGVAPVPAQRVLTLPGLRRRIDPVVPTAAAAATTTHEPSHGNDAPAVTEGARPSNSVDVRGALSDSSGSDEDDSDARVGRAAAAHRRRLVAAGLRSSHAAMTRAHGGHGTAAAAAPTATTAGIRLHACEPPPGSVYRAGRTFVRGGRGAPAGASGAADAASTALEEAKTAWFFETTSRGVRAGADWGISDSEDDGARGEADGDIALQTLCEFDTAGQLVPPDRDSAPLPLVDATAGKVQALCTALDVAALMLRTDSLVLDMN